MTPSGLSEWLADDVDIKDDIYTFHWSGSEESARLLGKKDNEFIKFQWLDDEEEGLETYFELRIKIAPLTKAITLHLTSFEYEDEMENTQMIWEDSISKLIRKLGN